MDDRHGKEARTLLSSHMMGAKVGKWLENPLVCLCSHAGEERRGHQRIHGKCIIMKNVYMVFKIFEPKYFFFSSMYILKHPHSMGMPDWVISIEQV